MARWSKIDLSLLKAAVDDGEGWEEIGDKLNRTAGACKGKYQDEFQAAWNLPSMTNVDEARQLASTDKRETRSRKPTEKVRQLNNNKRSLRQKAAAVSSKNTLGSSNKRKKSERSRHRTEKALLPLDGSSKVVKRRSMPERVKKRQGEGRRLTRTTLESSDVSSSEETIIVKQPPKAPRRRQITTKTTGGRAALTGAARKMAPSFTPSATAVAVSSENDDEPMDMDEKQPDAVGADIGAEHIAQSDGWTNEESFRFLRLFLAGGSIPRMQVAFPGRSHAAIVEQLGVLWERNPSMGATIV